MTLKHEMLIKKLPLNGYNVSKTMREVGYSEASSRAGSQYRILRNITRRVFDFNPEKTKRKILKAQKEFKKDKDNTNYARMIDLEAHIAIPTLQRNTIIQQQINLHPDNQRVIDKYLPSNKIDDKEVNKEISKEIGANNINNLPQDKAE